MFIRKDGISVGDVVTTTVHHQMFNSDIPDGTKVIVTEITKDGFTIKTVTDNDNESIKAFGIGWKI